MDPLRGKALEIFKQAWQSQLRGEIDRAIDLYSQSIGVCPTSEAYTFRGWAYSAQQRFEDAITECKKAIEVDPTLGNPYNDIGSYLMALGRADEAVEWLERAKVAARYEPRHFPFINLGRLYAAKGMLLQALAELRGALEQRPGDPVAEQAIEELQARLN